jgi:hypothetical protein
MNLNNKPQMMPPDLLKALSINMRPTEEEIQRLSKIYNYPADKV